MEMLTEDGDQKMRVVLMLVLYLQQPVWRNR
jgi:hypothetical protein